MKRMVENSEKLEELASAVEINNDNVKFNSGLTTSNITTIDGQKIYIINENMYEITEGTISSSVFNLGTALIISAIIPSDTQNGTYDWVHINLPNSESEIFTMKISGGRETELKIINDLNNKFQKINVKFDKSLAVHAYPDYFEFTVIVGTLTKEI